MAEKFYSLLTNIGKAKIANSVGLGTKINFVTMKVGDGGGAYYDPTEDQTDLKNTVWSGNINHVEIDAENPSWINIEVMIPSTVGGFTIREYGAFDEEGNMIGICKTAESYKPVIADGSTKELLLTLVLAVSNTESVTLKIDPTIIFAKKSEVEQLRTDVNAAIAGINSSLSEIVQEQTTQNNNIATNTNNINTNTQNITNNTTNITALKKKKIYCGNVDIASTSVAYKATSGISGLAYEDGMEITFIPNVDSGLNPTFQLDALTIYPILDHKGVVPTLAKIKANVPVKIVRVGNYFFISGGGDYDINDTVNIAKATPVYNNSAPVTQPFSVWSKTLTATSYTPLGLALYNFEYVACAYTTLASLYSFLDGVLKFNISATTFVKLTLDVDGNVYCILDSKLKVYSKSGTLLNTVTYANTVCGLIVDANKNVYIMIYSNPTYYLIKYTLSGSTLTTVWTCTLGTSTAYSLSLNDDNTYAYVGLGNGYVVKINTSTGAIALNLIVSSSGSNVSALIVKNGYVYTGFQNGTDKSNIKKLDKDLNLIWTKAISETSGTTSIAINAIDNNVYASGFTYFTKLDENGNLIFEVSDNGGIQTLIDCKENQFFRIYRQVKLDKYVECKDSYKTGYKIIG